MPQAQSQWQQLQLVGCVAVVLLLRMAMQCSLWLGKRRSRVGRVGKLLLYPVKSCRAVELNEAVITEHGLQSKKAGILDRSFVIVSDHKYVGLKQLPALTKVQPILLEQLQQQQQQQEQERQVEQDEGECALALAADGHATVRVRLTTSRCSFSMYGESLEGVVCCRESAAWLSKVCERPNLELLCVGRDEWRSTMPELREAARIGMSLTVLEDLPASADSRIAYANTSPLMLVSEATVRGIDRRLREAAKPGVDWRCFRPNLVLDEVEQEGAEDNWSFVTIADKCWLALLAPCTRCAITTVDPDAAALRQDREPLATLATYRKPSEKTSPTCGMLAFVEQGACVMVGDPVYC